MSEPTSLDWCDFLNARYNEKEDSIRIAVNIVRVDPANAEKWVIDLRRRLAGQRAAVQMLVDYEQGDYAPWNRDILRALAAEWVNHPDYPKETPSEPVA